MSPHLGHISSWRWIVCVEGIEDGVWAKYHFRQMILTPNFEALKFYNFLNAFIILIILVTRFGKFYLTRLIPGSTHSSTHLTSKKQGRGIEREQTQFLWQWPQHSECQIHSKCIYFLKKFQELFIFRAVPINSSYMRMNIFILAKVDQIVRGWQNSARPVDPTLTRPILYSSNPTHSKSGSVVGLLFPT